MRTTYITVSFKYKKEKRKLKNNTRLKDAYRASTAIYLVANDVCDAGKERVIILSYCGVSAYRLIKNVLAPYNRHIDVSFNDIVIQMRTHSATSTASNNYTS